MSAEMMTTSDSEAVRDSDAATGQLIMPFYLIIDVSSSMDGEVGNLDQAVAELVETIGRDPVVDDLVMLSIITFNHTAQTVVSLGSPSEISVPRFHASGGTNYGAAFTEYNRVFEQDRAALKQQGRKVYRPCVFFLTDGAPGDSDHLETFRSLFAYDPETRSGNRAFPYFVPYGFGTAPLPVIQSLAYPNFGLAKGRWFFSRSNNPGEVLKAMTTALGNTVISSGQSASKGVPQIVAPTPQPGSGMQFGEAGDTV